MIKNWLIKHLFCTVDPHQVMTTRRIENREYLLLNNEQLGEGEIGALQNEVRLLKNTRIWKIMTETLRDQAQQVMFTKSKDFQDMLAGKMMLYNIGVQETILNTIDQYNLK